MEKRVVFELTRSFFGHRLSGEVVEALQGGVDFTKAAGLARAHGVGSICYEALRELPHDFPTLSEARATFRREMHFNAYRAQRALLDAREILEVLGRQGIEPIVLKGLPLALNLYGDPALRPMGDLDLLVDERDAPMAVKALEAMGYMARGEIMTKWEGRNIESHLPILEARDRLPVEIHFRLFPRATPLFPDEEGLWERAIKAELAGVSFLKLAPADELIYLCGHILRHDSDAYKLIWFCDIALLDKALREDDRKALDGLLANSPKQHALLKALETAREWFLEGRGRAGYNPEVVMDSPVSLVERQVPEALSRLGMLLARMPTLRTKIRFILSYCFPRLAYIRQYHGARTGHEAWLWRVKRPFWAASRAIQSALTRGQRRGSAAKRSPF